MESTPLNQSWNHHLQNEERLTWPSSRLQSPYLAGQKRVSQDRRQMRQARSCAPGWQAWPLGSVHMSSPSVKWLSGVDYAFQKCTIFPFQGTLALSFINRRVNFASLGAQAELGTDIKCRVAEVTLSDFQGWDRKDDRASPWLCLGHTLGI